jgi:dsRNA-specific ribonuclease
MQDDMMKLVDAPSSFPARCLLCPSQKGPILDTGVDTPFPGPNAAGAVYVCRTCARKIAKVYGFAKGEKLEQLENAAEELTVLEKRMEAIQDNGNKLAMALTEEQQSHAATKALLDQHREREHQQQHFVQQLVSTANQLTVGTNGQ